MYRFLSSTFGKNREKSKDPRKIHRFIDIFLDTAIDIEKILS